MLRLTAWGGTVGRVVSRALRTGVTVGFIVGSTTPSAGAAAAKIDPQDAEFLASVNKSITELAGQPGSQASSTCDRIVASANEHGRVRLQMMRSPSQWPASLLASIVLGRSWMETRSLIVSREGLDRRGRWRL